MGSSEGIALKNIKEWPEEIVHKLGEIWITTVEQVVAMSATPGGLTSLAQHLGMSEEETCHLVAVVRTYLSEEDAARLEKSVDISEYGLGALKPLPPENED